MEERRRNEVGEGGRGETEMEKRREEDTEKKEFNNRGRIDWATKSAYAHSSSWKVKDLQNFLEAKARPVKSEFCPKEQNIRCL